jgi:LysM repeat protein
MLSWTAWKMAITPIHSICCLKREFNPMCKVLQLNNNSLMASLLAVCLSPVAAVHAATTEHPLLLQAEAGLAVGKADPQGEFFYRAALGYNVAQYMNVALEAGLAASHLAAAGSGQVNLAAEPYLRGRYAISDANALYLDAGYRTAGGHLAMGLGLSHRLTPGWQFNTGYRWYKQPNNALQGDVYTFALGLEYRFAVSQPSAAAPVQAAVQQLPPLSAGLDNTAVTTPEVQQDLSEQELSKEKLSKDELSKEEQGSGETGGATNIALQPEPQPDSYTIVRGDWLLQIARQHNINIDQLVKLNPWLNARQQRGWIIYPGEVLALQE